MINGKIVKIRRTGDGLLLKTGGGWKVLEEEIRMGKI